MENCESQQNVELLSIFYFSEEYMHPQTLLLFNRPILIRGNSVPQRCLKEKQVNFLTGSQ